MNFRQIASKLSPKGWAGVGGATIGGILFLYVLLHIASAPSYTTLQAGLDPSDTGKMTTALSAKGIPYELQNNGTALAVPTADSAQAQVALATAGLTGTSTQPGFSLFDTQSLGESDFQEQVTYQRALQGELAQEIDTVQGVTGAQVDLVLPNAQDELYSDSADGASAAVLLSGGENLDAGAVRGIAELVTSSVQGLTLDKVTITDDTGELLWPSSDGSGGGDGLLAKQSAQNTYDEDMASQVDAMLGQTLGPDKAMVEINADLNANQVAEDSLTYTGKGVPLTKSSDVEKLKSTGGGSGAAATTTATVPTYAQTTTGNSNYSHTVTNTTLGVDKTVTNSTIAPGAINRESVSLLVDTSIPKSELASLKASVANAVGLVPSRGDTISVAQMKFATNTTAKTATSATGGIMSEAKYGVLGLGTLFFLFFITRMLRRREREPLGNPVWLRELEAPRSLLELEDEVGDETPHVKRLRSPVNAAKRQIEDLVEREPDRVAAQVRQWMADD